MRSVTSGGDSCRVGRDYDFNFNDSGTPFSERNALATKNPLQRRHLYGFEDHVHDVAVLIDCAPQIKLLAVDFDEDFIGKECIAITLMPALQSPRKFGTEFKAPEPNRLVGYDYPALRE